MEGLNHFQVSRPLTNNRQFFTCEGARIMHGAIHNTNKFQSYSTKTHLETDEWCEAPPLPWCTVMGSKEKVFL